MADTSGHRNAFQWINYVHEQVFKCDRCNLAFNFQQDMMEHFLNNHNATIHYACSFCLKNFESSNLLLEHMQTQHIALVYLCSKCNSEFSSTTELFQHALLHTRKMAGSQNTSPPEKIAIEKRYLTCGACPRIFSQPSLLRSHAAIHLGSYHCCKGHRVSAVNVCYIDHYVNYSCLSCIESTGNCRDENDDSILKREELIDMESDDVVVICGECNKKFKSIKFLKLHLRDDHDIDIQCDDDDDDDDDDVAPVCSGDGHSQSNLENKGTSQNGTLYQPRASYSSRFACNFLCILCLKRFSNKRFLESHEKVHSNDIDPEQKLLMVCDFCQKSFKGEINLTKHQRSCRTSSNLQSNVDDSSNLTPDSLKSDFSTYRGFLESEKIKREVDSMIVDGEDLSFYIQPQFDGHELTELKEVGEIDNVADAISGFDQIRRRHNKKSNDADFVPSSDQRKRAIETKDILSYVCHYCLKGFRSKIKFLDHYFEHDKSVKLFSCTACETQFGYSSSIPKHVEMHLRELGVLSIRKSPNLCPKCGKNYRDRASLKRHEAMVHLKIGHLCFECDKKFSSPQALKQHLRQHNGEYLFECESCDKKYANPSSLHNHKKTHSQNKLTCNICDRTFSLKHHLTRHLARHTGFSVKFPK